MMTISNFVNRTSNHAIAMNLPHVLPRLLAAAVVCLFCSQLHAQQPAGEILATGSGRVVRFAPDFSVVWEQRAGNIHDVQLQANGNVLYADGHVTEVTPDKKVVFRYSPPAGQQGSFSCQRLDNGNTLVGENSSGKVMEIAPDGSVAFELQTRFKTEHPHHRIRWARKLENGNYLVCHARDRLVREYKPDGETAWEQAVPNVAFAALRLDNGNTMISSLDQITEFDSKGDIAWEFKKSDLPELGIRNMTGFQILKNGNLLIGCYSAYDKEGKGVGMFEITRDKKLVWAYQKPTDGRKVDNSMMGVQMIESP